MNKLTNSNKYCIDHLLKGIKRDINHYSSMKMKIPP